MIEEHINLTKKATDKEIEHLLDFIDKHFDTNANEKTQLRNIMKLSKYITENNIKIAEIEAEKILDISIKLNNAFKILDKTNKLINVYSFVNLIPILEFYCTINDVEIQSDVKIKLNEKNNKSDLDLLAIYFKDISQYKLLTKEEEKKLAKENTEDSLNKLVTHNLRLVVSIAKRYNNNYKLTLQDLIQFGNEGLIIASRKFDETKEYRFSTYATWWIRQSIQRGIANTTRTIRIPQEIYENVIKIQKAISKYDQEHLGDKPNIKKLCEITGLSEEKVVDAQKNMCDLISLSTPLSSEETEDTIGDKIEDERDLIEEKLEYLYIHETLQQIIKSCILSEREVEVLKLRYGMYGKEYTLMELSKIYKISPERLRQIEFRTLRKLRQAARNLEFLEGKGTKNILKYTVK